MTQTSPELAAPAADHVGADHPAAAEPADHPVRPLHLEAEATALVNSYVPWTAALGFVPLPVLDTAALLAIQLRMLAKLSDLYQIPYSENAVKGLVTTLLSNVVSAGVLGGLGALARTIPVIGPVVGVVVVPGAYSAATYAIGRVFISHFESGGTLLNFDPQKLRTHFEQEFVKAKQRAQGTLAAA